jgi:1,4-dihydroxy-6-naphthoate synthase
VQTIRLAYSPDSDDVFMFFALRHGRVRAPGLDFVHERADTETLNERAERGDVDVLAVSVARFAELTSDWLLLPHGMSVGRGYGPVVVARPELGLRGLASLRGRRVGVPGLRTTAHLVLRLLSPPLEPVPIPIEPFRRVFDAVDGGEVDAAVLIHEGRLTYGDRGLALVSDLGEAWLAETGLPLPLGGNAIRKGLGAETVARVSEACRASIAWALEHRDEVLAALLAEEVRPETGLDRARLDRYLSLYANDDTRSTAEDVRRAMAELFARGRRAALLPPGGEPEIAP